MEQSYYHRLESRFAECTTGCHFFVKTLWFAVLGIENWIRLLYTYRSVSHSVSLQTWTTCFHIWHHEHISTILFCRCCCYWINFRGVKPLALKTISAASSLSFLSTKRPCVHVQNIVKN